MENKIKEILQDYMTERQIELALPRLVNLISVNVPVIKSFSPAVAKGMLAVRDAIVERDIDEAYHQLYMICSPNFDKMSHEVWAELEAIAGENV